MLRLTIGARCTASHTAEGVEGRLGARNVAGQYRGGQLTQLATPRRANVRAVDCYHTRVGRQPPKALMMMMMMMMTAAPTGPSP